MLAELGALLEEGALDGMLPNLRKALAPEGRPLYVLPALYHYVATHPRLARALH